MTRNATPRLNVVLNVCMWCGKDAGIVIGKKLITDESKALPRRAVYSNDPCQNCQTNMAKGITCVEVSQEPTCKQCLPDVMTGRWVIAKEEAIREYVSDFYGEDNVEKKMKKILNNKPAILLFDTSMFELVFGAAMKNNEPQ